jgi:uncharacterized membrane protein
MSETELEAAPLDRPATPEIETITVSDVKTALGKGIRDFQAAPLFGLFFGAFYALGGWALLALAVTLKINYYVWPMATGFAMVAPFVAAGLYEVSRRLEAGEPLSWRPVLSSVRTAGGKSLNWMVLVTTFAYIIWLDIAIALYVIFYGLKPLALPELLTAIVTTVDGFAFFAIGNLVGLALSLAVFSITVVSFPLLFERNVDFVTAMITSVRTVLASPKPMIVWCAIIGALLGLSILSVFVGLLVVLPVLGHATWHLYRKAVCPIG